MEKQIRDLFTPSILDEALEVMGGDPASVQKLDGFESFIYRFTRQDKPYILRITHNSHRSWQAITGELEWLNYLIKHGVRVAHPVPSSNGRFVEVIGQPDAEQSYWTTVAFEMAPGRPPVKSDWTPKLIESMGRLMGRMHFLTKDFEPSRPEFRRESWNREATSLVKGLPESESKVVSKYAELRAYLATLPQDRDSYGLVHSDFHGMNFFVDDGEITLFDFDDSCYCWFIYDIAMSLFYVLPHNCVAGEQLERGRQFLMSFMKAYQEENRLDARWILEIPHFLKLREIELYLAILHSQALESLGPWAQSYMKDRRFKIENDVPYAPLDYKSLATAIG